MYSPVQQLVKRIKYEYPDNNSYEGAVSINEEHLRRSGRTPKPSSKLQDYEVTMMGRSFEDNNTTAAAGQTAAARLLQNVINNNNDELVLLRAAASAAYGRDRAWSNCSDYSNNSSSASNSNHSSSASADDPEVLEAARILLLLRQQFRGPVMTSPSTPIIGNDDEENHHNDDSHDNTLSLLSLTTTSTRPTKQQQQQRRPYNAPIINPNMRRSFDGVSKLSSMDPEQAARRRKNTEAARYSRYQSRLREEELEKRLEDADKANADAKWRVATKRAYLQGLFGYLGVEGVDLTARDGLRMAKAEVKRKCELRGIRTSSLD